MPMPFGGVRPRGRLRPAPQRDALGEAIARLEAKTGHKVTETQKVIGDRETFREWCERLGAEGMKVDGRRFTLDNRPAMAWIYDQVPSTQEEAYNYVLVLMKCAQVGFTVMEMLAVIYLGLKFGPGTVGMFLPTMDLANLKSTERFMPIVRSVPAVHELMTQDAADGSGRKRGEGNVNRRRIDNALFVISWTSGKASTESIPMDVVSYDEVQEMSLEQIEKTQERLSASELRFTLMGSTANWPDSDIHHWYKRGSQWRFHSRCPTCGAEKPLDDYFPACIKWDGERGAYRYVCEAGHWLNDPQEGEWRPDDLENGEPTFDRSLPRRDWPLRIRSIHFPQFLSPTISAGNILQAYNDATDLKNFYNRKLGKPYLDPSQIPVTLEHLAACVEAGKTAVAGGVQWKSRARGTFMGIDQMGNLNVHIIKERLPDGRQACVHAELSYGADPFARSSELMDLYGVQCCVVEINPNYNDAKKFANRHPGRVFICDSFGALPDAMVKWGDASRLDASERRTDEEAQDLYTVKVDQYKTMQVALSRFTSKVPMCVFPNPKELVQEIIEKGVRSIKPVLDVMFEHFTKTALVAEKDEETNKYKRSVKKIKIDPHFSYANQLCDVAWSRAHGTSTFILPEGPSVESENRARAIEQDMPGAPAHIMRMMDTLPAGVCGRCAAYPMGDEEMPATGICAARGMIVQARDPSCGFFVEAS